MSAVYAYEISQRNIMRGCITRSLRVCNDLNDMVRRDISVAAIRAWERLAAIGIAIEHEAYEFDNGLIQAESSPYVKDVMFSLSDEISNVCYKFDTMGSMFDKCPDLAKVRSLLAKVKDSLNALNQTINYEIEMWKGGVNHDSCHEAEEYGNDDDDDDDEECTE